jgi:DNA-binding transcriptional LysR family regulator
MLCTMRDPLLHLESFVVLADRIATRGRGAFDGAAHELGIDRSVLRRRMQALTAHVGAPLLHGRGTALALTASGVRLRDHARTIVAQTHDLARIVRGARERVVVACTGTVTTELLPRVLKDLDAEPRASIDLVVRRAGGALAERMLLSGEADVAVVRSERAPGAFAAQLLADDRLWLVVPKKHPLASGPLEPARLASSPLILYGAASRTRARVMQRLAPHGAFVRVEVDEKSAALEYVRAGLGVTFVSLLAGHEPSDARLVFRDVTAQFARTRFWATCRPERRADAVVDRVLKLLDRHAHARRPR